MEDKKLLERFSALHKLVSRVHDQCKMEHDVMTLIDIFAQHHNLSEAFHADCEMYLRPDKSPSTQLMNMLTEINTALHCSAMHIHQHAVQLRTPIIGHFIKQLVEPRMFPN